MGAVKNHYHEQICFGEADMQSDEAVEDYFRGLQQQQLVDMAERMEELEELLGIIRDRLKADALLDVEREILDARATITEMRRILPGLEA